MVILFFWYFSLEGYEAMRWGDSNSKGLGVSNPCDILMVVTRIKPTKKRLEIV
jgi:hypothetical protein